MFGFSLPKLLFTVLVIGAVWYGYKLLGRRDGDTGAGDTVKCLVCGVYVPVEGADNCGKKGCPYSS